MVEEVEENTAVPAVDLAVKLIIVDLRKVGFVVKFAVYKRLEPGQLPVISNQPRLTNMSVFASPSKLSVESSTTVASPTFDVFN